MARWIPYEKRTLADMEQELANDFARWDTLFENGGNDPSWSDGVNLNLVRNHIIHDLKIIEEMENPDDGYQLSLFETVRAKRRDIPPELPDDYMSRPDEIRLNIKTVCEWLRESEEYKKLCTMCSQVEPRIFKKEYLGTYTGCLTTVATSIAKDNLVDARRLGNLDNIKAMVIRGLERLTTILGDGYVEPQEDDFDDEDDVSA